MRIRDSPRARPAGLAGLGRLRPRGGPTGRASGPRPTSPSRPARSAPGCTPGACAGSRSSAGPSAAATPRPSTATRCRASTSPGAPGPASSRRSSRACARARSRASCRCAFAIASTSFTTHGRRRSTACAATSWSRARVERGQASSRTVGRRFRAQGAGRSSSPPAASAATSTSCARAGRSGSATPPKRMICGVPDHVDGRMLAITEAAGGNIINRDRMWHYTEGIQNWTPIWTRHGIRILPGPVVHVVRRARAAAAGAAVSRLRHAGHARPHHADGLRLLLVRAQPEDHRARVRAVGLRAEPRPHQRQLAQRHQEPARRRRAAAGARLHGEGRRLHRRAQPRRPRRSA